MIPRLFLALTLVSALAGSPHLSALSRSAAREQGAPEAGILARIEKSGADGGVAFRTLDGKMEWFSRADDVFHAASIMKIPVMIELFHQVTQAKLKLGDSLPAKN